MWHTNIQAGKLKNHTRYSVWANFESEERGFRKGVSIGLIKSEAAALATTEERKEFQDKSL